MSHKRYYWHDYIKKTISKYPDDLGDDIQGNVARIAILTTLRDVATMVDGVDRIRLINMVYFDKTHNLIGASYVIGISERTAQRWDHTFVYLVAKRMGFNAN